MASSEASCYTLVVEPSTDAPTLQELRSGLEKGSDEVKIDTLRKILALTINGNPQVSKPQIPRLLAVISLAVPVPAHIVDANHTICYANAKQEAEKATPFLLGSVSEIRREL